MERLTNKDHKELGFCAYVGAQNPFKTPMTIGELAGCLNVDYSPRKILEDILGRLAAYEDTGLEPDEIEFYREAQDHTESMSPKRFIEIAQAEKDGRLVVLPCKVGDTVYQIDYMTHSEALKSGVPQSEDHWQYRKYGRKRAKYLPLIVREKKMAKYLYPEIGKTVFLTREEADAALKKREADNGADR